MEAFVESNKDNKFNYLFGDLLQNPALDQILALLAS